MKLIMVSDSVNMKKLLIVIVIGIVTLPLQNGCDEQSSSNSRNLNKPRSTNPYGRLTGNRRYSEKQANKMQDASFKLLNSLVPSVKDTLSHAKRMRNPYIEDSNLSKYTVWAEANLSPFSGTRPVWDARTDEQYVGMFWDVLWIADPVLIDWQPWNVDWKKSSDNRISINKNNRRGVETRVLFVYKMDDDGAPELISAFISDPLGDPNTDTGHANYALEFLSFVSLNIPKLSKIDSRRMTSSDYYKIIPDSMNFTRQELESYLGRRGSQ